MVFSSRTMLTRYLGCLEIFLTSFFLTGLILVTCLLSFTYCLKVVSFWIEALSVSVLSWDESDSLSEVSAESLSLSARRVEYSFLEYVQTSAPRKCLFLWYQNFHSGNLGKICVLDIVWMKKFYIFYLSFCFDEWSVYHFTGNYVSFWNNILVVSYVLYVNY